MREKKVTNEPRLEFAEAVFNRGLFADNFLGQRLPMEPDWLVADGLEDAFQAIRSLYAEKVASLATSNEPQTERDFIRPVFDILWQEAKPGDCYQVQPSLPNVDARRQPDYAFFRTAAEKEAVEPKKGTIEYWADVPCLGDAKKWSAPLDKVRGADENPSAQIANYLYRSRVRWGILTNGRIWRLYEREKSSAGGVYYQVDLEDILKRQDISVFKHFFMFFRRAAFLPDINGKAFLDKVFQGSVDYATEVGDSLKESVYDALRLLMTGFIENSANELDPNDPHVVKLVHENSLIVLYRLLFLLYAEDKALLPLANPVYKDYSVKLLQKRNNDRLRGGRTFFRAERHSWSALIRLFELIDRGMKDEGKPIISEYNGGLFSPCKHPHIAHTPQEGSKRWEIGDNRLAQVIDMLAYRRDKWDQPGSDDIDYKSLDVQHLGGIYEGLLELQPKIADETLIEVMENGKPVFKPTAQVTKPRPIRGQNPRHIAKAEVYLITNRGERKATGSYYTPKYIVDYIVDNTVGPLVDEAAEKVAKLHPSVKNEISKLEKLHQERADNPVEAEKTRQAIAQQKDRLLGPYLSLKILDPAMGSGHFLVGAADFLSLAMATDPNLIEPDAPNGEDPQAYYKRLVVERCLYGVDLNPLAVELAKLSLWLHTVSRDKALSFLDHHLRCGNSLIGARIEDDLVREPPRFNASGKCINEDDAQLILGFAETLAATHLQYFLDTFRKIVETPTADAATERAKDRWYWEMDVVREKFRAVANCWLAPFFGVSITAQQYESAVKALRGSVEDWNAVADTRWFKDAQEMAQDDQKSFFHWELEFPDVFFEPHGFKPKEARGFSTVLGNPPYVDSENMVKAMPAERAYVTARFRTATGNWDLYIPFWELAFRLATNQGYIALITPNKWLSIGYGTALREYSRPYLYRIGDFSATKVFEDSSIFPVVAFIKKGATDGLFVQVFDADRSLVRQCWLPRDMLQDTRAWGIIFSDSPGIIRSMIDSSHKLSQICEVDEPFTVSEAYQLSELVHEMEPGEEDCFRLVVTGTIDRYVSLWGVVPTTYLGSEYDEPVVNARVLEERFPRRYRQASERKLVISGIRHFEAILDQEGTVLAAKSTVIVRGFPDEGYKAKALLAIVNSSAMTYYINQVYGALSMDGGINFSAPLVRELPIPKVDFALPAEARTSFLDLGKHLYHSHIASGDRTPVLNFAEERLCEISNHSSVMHDLIAFLAEQMIEMNMEEQKEVKGFLTWLEHQIGAQVKDLSNKTRAKAYHDHDLKSLLDVLRQNKRRIQVDPDARKVQEKIEKEFNVSTGKLRPLKDRIAATDRLIDLIVYKLYGLTEEGIKIVEGESAG